MPRDGALIHTTAPEGSAACYKLVHVVVKKKKTRDDVNVPEQT